MSFTTLLSHRLIFILLIVSCLHGCAAVVVGGGATAATLALDRRTTGTVVEDESIELKSRKLYLDNPELRDKTHINFTSYNTRVLITGEAPTDDLKTKVVELVRGVDKVSHVYDEVTLAAPSSLTSRSSDSIITSKVKTQLLANDSLPGTAIKVVTEKGVVYLMGLVTRTEADGATNVARQTGGVQKVVRLFQYTD